jgi:hypothetical protein
LVIGHYNLKEKSLLVPNIIFLFLVIFWVEKREGVAGFRLRERKLPLKKILATKTVDCCVKRFHMTRNVKIEFHNLF